MQAICVIPHQAGSVLITRTVPVSGFGEAIARRPDDIKTTVQFAEFGT